MVVQAQSDLKENPARQAIMEALVPLARLVQLALSDHKVNPVHQVTMEVQAP